MNRVEEACHRFANGNVCAQAVLAVFAKELGLPEPLAMKFGVGFAGGIGMGGHTCGALSGAVAVLGLAYGSDDIQDSASKAKVLQKVKALREAFEDEFKTLTCKGLLVCDISTQEGLERAKENALFQTKCPLFVKRSVEILEDLLCE